MIPLAKARIETMLIQLQKDFPDHFPDDGRLPLPWKRGLWRSVRDYYQNTPLRFQASGVVVRRAMYRWRTQHQHLYHQAVKTNPFRYNLNGQPVPKKTLKSLP